MGLEEKLDHGPDNAIVLVVSLDLLLLELLDDRRFGRDSKGHLGEHLR